MADNASFTVHGTDGVHAETHMRDPSFVMTGHHCHSCYELYYVHSGECRVLIDERFSDLHAGDFILIPPMVLHYTRYLHGSCLRSVILFRREDVSEDVLSCMPGREQFFAEAGIFRVPEPAKPDMEQIIAHLTAEDAGPDSLSPFFRRSLLHILLLNCARECAFLPGAATDIRTNDRQVLEAARYIGENYMHPITTEDVASAVGFSPNYLTRRFRLSAGIGLHEYIVFIRLHHAAQELVTTTDSITDIALRCGFSDSNYFKDSFKKKYGITPRTYRKMS